MGSLPFLFFLNLNLLGAMAHTVCEKELQLWAGLLLLCSNGSPPASLSFVSSFCPRQAGAAANPRKQRTQVLGAPHTSSPPPGTRTDHTCFVDAAAPPMKSQSFSFRRKKGSIIFVQKAKEKKKKLSRESIIYHSRRWCLCFHCHRKKISFFTPNIPKKNATLVFWIIFFCV